ncbi:MAG: ABC transporter substrate-binding protein [Nocardioides sp.]|nr:ABC transporter substrate-binding protein [Nocardioides sp.]
MVGRPVVPILLGAGLLALSACAGAPEAAEKKPASGESFPVEVTSCGHTATITAKPERAVTLNQGATEVVLALGLEDQLAGTAYLDDEVPAKWQDAYESVDVLSEEYPTRDQMLETEPDFAYASYASAFEKKAVGTQAELEKAGAASYVSPFGCPDEVDRPEPSFEAVWDEMDAVAEAFGAPARAARFRAEQERLLEGLEETQAGDDLSVLWYDSGDKTPFVGAGGGGPQLILDAAGADNIFEDVEGGWGDASWEKVIDADPDVIVLADASWSTAEDKIAYLEKDPLLKQLRAVRAERYVTIPFSESTPGVRLADGAASVSDQLEKLDLSK